MAHDRTAEASTSGGQPPLRKGGHRGAAQRQHGNRSGSKELHGGQHKQQLRQAGHGMQHQAAGVRQEPQRQTQLVPLRRTTKQTLQQQEHRQQPQQQHKQQQPEQLRKRRRNQQSREEEHSDSGDDDDDSDGSSDDEDRQEDGDREEEADGMDSDTMEEALQKQVADVPFEVLEALRQDGTGLVGHAARAAAKAAQEQQRDFHRANRHRPSEMSSKRPVPRFREVIQVTKREPSDPRFADGGKGRGAPPTASGGSFVDKNYAFLYDELIPQERQELKDKMKKTRSFDEKARLQAELKKLDDAARKEQTRRKKVKLAQEIKTAEKQAVASGKKPFYLKKSEQRRLELLSKYEELKKSGRLDKFMEKRRKKNAAKDHRYLPSQRREV